MPKQSSNISDARSTAPLFNTSLGQHILKNPLIATAIVDKACIAPSDHVLEIGPGTGNLTIKLLEKAASVTAIEKDPRLAAELVKRIQTRPDLFRKLRVIVDDVLNVTPLPHCHIVVSNTPYQISSPLVFKLLEHRPLFRVAVLMFQREFALRLVAAPGSELYSRLSVNVQLMSKVDHIMRIGKNNFKPPPKVDSSVVLITPKVPQPTVEFGEWDGLLRIAFTRKNKTMLGNFASSNVLNMMIQNRKVYCSLKELKYEDVDEKCMKAKIENILRTLDVADKRPGKMDMDDFLRVLCAFHTENLHFA